MVIRAIGIMVLSMALLALSDAFIKLAAQYAPMGQIMFAISAGGTLMFVIMARFKRYPLITRDALHPMVLFRNLAEIVGAVGLVIGISKVPLSIFAAIMQVAPLLTILGAAVFLKEPVGWRRWAAVFVGLIGMLVVIRPFGANFTGWELFAVLGVSGLAARDLVTRLSPSHIPALTMSTWGFGATLPVGLVILLFEDRALDFAPLTVAHLVGAVVFTAIGYLAVTAAMRMAPVSIIAPFRYTRLIFTAGLGIMIFGERPDGYTYLGAAMVLAAGVYSFLRERAIVKQGGAD